MIPFPGGPPVTGTTVRTLRSGARRSSPCPACGGSRISADGYCERCGQLQPSGRDHVEVDAGFAAGVSDRGLRPAHNEDAMALASAIAPDGRAAGVVLVCDGVSSTPRAADASLVAVRTGAKALTDAVGHGVEPEPASRAAVARAAAAVAALGDDAPSSTYVSALVTDTLVTVAWVGDSRAYWLGDPAGASRSELAGADGAGPEQLTRDDSWAAEKIASGELSFEQAYADHRAHTITGWLGSDAGDVRPHVRTFVPARSGVVLVCSDGLWNYLPEPGQLAAVVPQAPTAPLEAARALVADALAAGGDDNVTVVIIPFPFPHGGRPAKGSIQ